MSGKINDYSEPVALSLEESTEVDGEHVLAKVRGPFFFPGGVSRNKRYYPPKLWENALVNEEVQKKLHDRTMLGTVYHPQQEPPLEDNSHIVTRLWIDPNNSKIGLGEALIINTEKGRALNTLLRLGSKWCVSSRATGRFLPDKNESGMPVVDPDSYILQTFDFTPDPGFIDANPKLVESLLPEFKSQIDQKITEVNSIMSGENTNQQMFESLLNEKRNLESTISELLTENERYSKFGSPDEVAKALELANTQSTILKEYLDRGSVEDIDTISEEFDSMSSLLEKYNSLGSTSQIKEVFGKVGSTLAMLNEYRRLGAPQDIKEVYIKASKMGDIIERYQHLGTPSKIEKVFEESLRGLNIISKYKEMGSTEEIKEVFDVTSKLVSTLKEYSAIGSIDEIQESYQKVVGALTELKSYKTLASVDEVKSYVDLGDPKSIQETFDKTEEFVKFHRLQELTASSPRLAAEFGMSESIVKTVIEAIGDDETKIKATLTKMREANKNRVNYFPTEKVNEEKSTDFNRSMIRSIAESV